MTPHPRYTFVRGNITDKDLILRLLHNYAIDAIVHFAAQSHVARATMLLLEKGEINEIYNIGTDQEWSVMDVARLLVTEMTSDGILENHVTFVADRPFNDFRYSVDSTRLRELGWRELHTDFKANVRSLIVAATATAAR